MAAYAITTYNTGVQDTVQLCLDALETKLETLDSTNNPIHGIGVETTGRDRQQAIGWIVYEA